MTTIEMLNVYELPLKPPTRCLRAVRGELTEAETTEGAATLPITMPTTPASAKQDTFKHKLTHHRTVAKANGFKGTNFFGSFTHCVKHHE